MKMVQNHLEYFLSFVLGIEHILFSFICKFFSYLIFIRNPQGYSQFSSPEVNDNYTALLPSDEKSDLVAQGNQSSPHSSVRLTRGSFQQSNRPISSSSMTPIRLLNPMNSSNSPRPSQSNNMDTTNNNEFLDFIQQPTTTVYSPTSASTSASTNPAKNSFNGRENTNSGDIEEEGVRLSRIT